MNNLLKYLLAALTGGSVGGGATALSGDEVSVIQSAISAIVTGIITIIALWTRSPKDE